MVRKHVVACITFILFLLFYCQNQSKQESYRVATNNKDLKTNAKKGKKKKEDLDDLKKELEMDEHKISFDELCQRLSTHMEKVKETKLKKLI